MSLPKKNTLTMCGETKAHLLLTLWQNVWEKNSATNVTPQFQFSHKMCNDQLFLTLLNIKSNCTYFN